jgi:hypothetical protein
VHRTPLARLQLTNVAAPSQPTVAAMQAQTVSREAASSSRPTGGAASASVSSPPSTPGFSGGSSNGGSSSSGSGAGQPRAAVAGSGSGASGVTAAPPPGVPKKTFPVEGAEVRGGQGANGGVGTHYEGSWAHAA